LESARIKYCPLSAGPTLAGMVTESEVAVAKLTVPRVANLIWVTVPPIPSERVPVPKVAKVGVVPSSCHTTLNALPAVMVVDPTGAVNSTVARTRGTRATRAEKA